MASKFKAGTRFICNDTGAEMEVVEIETEESGHWSIHGLLKVNHRVVKIKTATTGKVTTYSLDHVEKWNVTILEADDATA